MTRHRARLPARWAVATVVARSTACALEFATLVYFAYLGGEFNRRIVFYFIPYVAVRV